MFRQISIFVLVIISQLIIGCSGGASNNPALNTPPDRVALYEIGRLQAGKHYQVIESAWNEPANKVQEFFWLGCPHCYQLDPLVSEWKSRRVGRIEFEHLPVSLAAHWNTDARFYFALQQLGLAEKLHKATFAAVQGKQLHTGNDESIRAFLKNAGVDSAEVIDAMSGDRVNDKLDAANTMARRAKITGVPAIVVGGMYLVSLGEYVPSNKDMLRVAYALSQAHKQEK